MRYVAGMDITKMNGKIIPLSNKNYTNLNLLVVCLLIMTNKYGINHQTYMYSIVPKDFGLRRKFLPLEIHGILTTIYSKKSEF